MRAAILASLVPYVTSSYGTHSLLTTIEIVASTMAAASYIPVAKLLDVWGRAEGFALMTGFATLGLILMASAKTLAVFCAAQVRACISSACESMFELTKHRSSILLAFLASSLRWPFLLQMSHLSRIEVLRSLSLLLHT